MTMIDAMKNSIIGRFFSALLAVILFTGTFCSSVPLKTASVNDKMTIPEIFEVSDSVFMKLKSDTPELHFGTAGGEWTAVALARSGYIPTDSEYFDAYYNELAVEIPKMAEGNSPDGALNKFKSTENSRLIIAMTAVGRDPHDVGGLDLTAPYSDTAWVTKQGINAAAYALIALDCCGYDNDKVKSHCIGYILDKQLDDGGWALTGERADPDVTAMVLQALAPHQSDENVRTAAMSGIEALSKLQTENGSYISMGKENSNSISQVIIACSSLGIDAMTDERFTKNGISAFEALFRYCDHERKEFSRFEGGEADRLATEQAACALAAYQRFLCGKNSFYDMSDEGSLRAVVLYSGDTAETASSRKMTIAIAVPEPYNGNALGFKNGDTTIAFYHSGKASEMLGDAVYFGFVPYEIDYRLLTDSSNYTNIESESNELFFGDADENGIINAQDALYAASVWSGRAKEFPDEKMFLSIDIDGNGRIDMDDAELIKNIFISDITPEIIEKSCRVLGGKN